MAFLTGKCNGVFELLGVIKTAAVAQNWLVVDEKTVPYDDIPRDGRYCYSEGETGAISSSVTNSGKSFKVIMPREFSVVSVSFKTASKVTIYGITYDQTRELIGTDVATDTTFSADIQAKKFIQLEVTSSQNIQDFHIKVTNSTYPTLEKSLVISNANSEDNVIANFSAFIMQGGKANLKMTTSTGHSPNLAINDQLNAKVGSMLGDDGEIEYYISINGARLIIALKIHRPDDAVQKNEVWQVGYLGRIRLYGGQWSLPDCNAIVASAFSDIRWSDANGANFTKPFVYFSGKFSEASSTALSSNTTNANNCNIEAPTSDTIFSTPIICYNTNNVFGELDGLYSIVAPSGVNRTDEISIDGTPYLVMQDGIGFNKYDAMAMRKDV